MGKERQGGVRRPSEKNMRRGPRISPVHSFHIN